jgi:hypothetical protein
LISRNCTSRGHSGQSGPGAGRAPLIIAYDAFAPG